MAKKPLTDPNYETWRQNLSFEDRMNLAKNYTPDLTFPELNPTLKSSAQINAPDLPFLKDSPYTTDIGSFDPYSTWRDSSEPVNVSQEPTDNRTNAEKGLNIFGGTFTPFQDIGNFLEKGIDYNPNKPGRQDQEDLWLDDVDDTYAHENKMDLISRYGTDDMDIIREIIATKHYGDTIGENQMIDPKTGSLIDLPEPPPRPSVPVESEDEFYDEDIVIEPDAPLPEFEDWVAYDQDKVDDMKKYGQWDDNLNFTENIRNYEEWESGYHPFDQNWRRATGKRIWDQDQADAWAYEDILAGAQDQITQSRDDRQEIVNQNIQIRQDNENLINNAKNDLTDQITELEDWLENNQYSGQVDQDGNVIAEVKKVELNNLKNQLENFDPNQVPGLKTEQDVPESLSMIDIEGTKEYEAEQDRLKAIEDEKIAQQNIGEGLGYHPDDPRWQAQHDKFMHMGTPESGKSSDVTEEMYNAKPWRNESQEQVHDSLFEDYQGQDFFEDKNGDGHIDPGEVDVSKMTEKEKKKYEKWAAKDLKRKERRFKNYRTKFGGKDDSGVYRDKDWWKNEYKQRKKDAFQDWKDNRAKPFNRDWRIANNKWTIMPKKREHFDSDEEYNEYKKQRANKMDTWAEIFKGAPGEFGGLAQLFFAAAGANPWEYKDYFGNNEE